MMCMAWTLSLITVTTSANAQTSDIPWIWHTSDAPHDAQQIALLLDHLVLSKTRIDIRHRMLRLVVAPDVQVTPVVHVQTDSSQAPQLGDQHTEAISRAITAAARRSTSGWVQLDFEAYDSQKKYYIELVKNIKQKLPASVKLSVTVLASWCSEPGLIAQLSADEIVPMFFKMGSNTEAYRDRLYYHPELLDARCRNQAIGLSVQEAPTAAVQQRYQHRYWFNYKNWHNTTPFATSQNFLRKE